MTSHTLSRNVSSASLASSQNARSRRNTANLDPFAAEKEEKASRIAAAARDRNLSALIDLATSRYGLVNDSLRRTAWPILLGYSNDTPRDRTPWSSLPAHRDENQVALDVNRAFVYYPNGESDRQLDRRKEELSDVIVEVLRRHPVLYYFQGYHDIVQVFLLVLGAQEAPAAVTRLSLLRIRDFMLPSLDPAISHLELLHPIIKTADPVLYNHLPKMQPFFALAGTTTLFAHLIQEYGDIARLFDFFLARDAVIPVYFFAVVLLLRRDELLEIEKDETDILHATLGKLPQPLDLELLITQTNDLYAKHPPESLRSWVWWKVSSSSVLKATKTPFDVTKQSIQDGEAFFQQQEVELRRRQAFNRAVKSVQRVRTQMWIYRRPGAFGLAIAVGVYALWLGRSGGVNARVSNFGPLGGFIKRIMSGFV
ncbi:hypothetical protein K469DRAFT_195486 [Zopfia rhizophila CBS 207.26]|uniref:Rab-GAP TBC domain-containing protein n=1 Tax=Zopfia rhizophila CBS 207.26 TaxID=1314779 RepID=A0A6A6EU59_9PEZI|nr:hypothetical protein K469DRAFT_195486 [Zopfia rhizophila CBS 207.26]